MFKSGYVYILTNKNKTTLYVGVTSDLPNRIRQHKEHEFAKSFSDKYNLELLIHYEAFEGIEEAIAREKQIKRWNRAKKEHLINALNPLWKDLYDEMLYDLL